MSGSLGDIFDYQKFLGKDVLHKWKEDPERALLGINTPFESKVWGGILGKDYEPSIDMFGGDTEDQARDATSRGINTGPGEKMHDLARAITSFFAGSYGAGKLGMGGGAVDGGATSFPVGGSGAPEISGFATGADPFVSASGGSLMGAPGSMPTAGVGMNWMDYARIANMGSNMMRQGQQSGYTPQLQTGPQGVLRSPYYSPEFVPVYPGALQPFITRG